MFLGHNRFFDGIHAADPGAVAIIAVIDVARADTLQPGNALWFLPVGGPYQVPHVGPGSTENALEFQARHHIGMLPIEVGVHRGRIVDLGSRSQDHRAHLDGAGDFLLVVDHGVGLARGHTLVAFGADSAGQAARRLGQHLVLGETELYLIEPLHAFSRIETRHLFTRNPIVALSANLLNRQPFSFAPFLEVRPLHKAVDGDGRLLPCRNGFDNRPWPGYRIAPGEDIRIVALQGKRIDPHGAAVTEGTGTFGSQTGPVGFLPQGRNHRVDLDDEFRSRYLDGSSPAALVGFPQFHADAFDSLDPPVFADDPHGGGEGHDLDAFFPAFFDFFLIGGHFLMAAPIDDEGFGRPEAPGAAHGIHGNIAAADHGHSIAQDDVLPQVDPAQKVRTRVDPFQVLALYPKDLAFVGSNGQEESLVALLAQLSNGEVPAQVHPGSKLDPQVTDDLDFRFDDIPRQPIRGDAHRQHPAQDRQLFENGHPVACDSQIVGT